MKPKSIPQMPSPTRGGAATVTLAAAMLCAAAGTAASATLIDLRTGDGPGERIEGESSEPGHEGWIEILSVGLATEKGTSSTTRRGVPKLGDVIVAKEFDKSSLPLQEAAFSGEVFPELIIEFPLVGEHPGVVVSFSDVVVTRYRTSFEVGNRVTGRPTEEIAFHYDKIKWTFTEFDHDHAAPPPPDVFSFDRLFGTGEPGRDDDGDGIPNDLDHDDDNDLIDDEYELENGLHPLVEDGHYDDDGDDKSNYEEWIAGTRSDDANSRFAIHSIAFARDGTCTVAVPTIGGRHYRLRGSFDLAAGRWIDFDEFVTGPDAEPGLMELELPPGAAAQFERLFFSVEVSLPGQP